jgi:DNA-binding FrmR family transcriptional regulator
MAHADNADLLNRLKRAHGHLGKIVAMVGDGRDGVTIAQQMQAVVSALEKAKNVLILDHIEHHLEDAIGPLSKAAREELAKLAELAKYL